MYLLARRLSKSRLGGWVGALAFTFSAYLTGYPVLQLAILETVVWLPWIFLALDHAAGHLAAGPQRRAVAPVILAGVLFGVSILAGHPQSALLAGYAALGFAVFRGIQATRGRGRRSRLGALGGDAGVSPHRQGWSPRPNCCRRSSICDSQPGPASASTWPAAG